MRHRLSLLPLLLVAVLAGGVAPSGASADYRAVYNDCNDGTLDGTYSAKELQDALRKFEANMSDYTECADAIYRSQMGLDGKGGDKGGGSGSGSGGGTAGGGTGGGSGSGGGSTGVGTPAGTLGSGSGANGSGGSSGAGAGGGSTDGPVTLAPDDVRAAPEAEKVAAVAAATQAAEREAGARAAQLRDVPVPASALQLGASSTDLPLPLLLTLVACVGAACVAGGTTGLQAVRRRRGR